MIEFLVTISRQRLRPQYGDGFRNAPLVPSQPVQSQIRSDRGANQDASGTKAEADPSVTRMFEPDRMAPVNLQVAYEQVVQLTNTGYSP